MFDCFPTKDVSQNQKQRGRTEGMGQAGESFVGGPDVRVGAQGLVVVGSSWLTLDEVWVSTYGSSSR